MTIEMGGPCKKMAEFEQRTGRGVVCGAKKLVGRTCQPMGWDDRCICACGRGHSVSTTKGHDSAARGRRMAEAARHEHGRRFLVVHSLTLRNGAHCLSGSVPHRAQPNACISRQYSAHHHPTRLKLLHVTRTQTQPNPQITMASPGEIQRKEEDPSKQILFRFCSEW
jgi:hypothetical protein